VAFELMSIPLYYLTGFLKREEEAVEAALKFFLVGTVSSAVLVYGLSFVYGIAGTTDLGGIASALRTGHPLILLGVVLALGGSASRSPRFRFTCGCPTLTRRRARRSWRGCRWRRRRRGSS
jgi:NADH-quinone oxidoreductase subunit N